MATTNESSPTTRSNNVRAAVVQAAPVLFNTPKSLQRLADLSADAAKQGAELIVFPEAFIGGYPKGHDFGVSLGMRTPEGREDFRRLFENAIDVPGPATEFIGSVANDHALHLVVGVVEREGGTLYCTALILGPDGQLLGKHRKRWLHAAGRDDKTRQARLDDLLGELHALVADGDVRQGRRIVLRHYRGRPGDVAFIHPTYRTGRPLFRPVGVSNPSAGRSPFRLSNRTVPSVSGRIDPRR
jgi:hypothetical protein